MITRQEVDDYIQAKPHIYSYPYGQFWKVRIGERSVMDGKYTNKLYADRALTTHVGEVIEGNRRRLKKRENNAKKTKS